VHALRGRDERCRERFAINARCFAPEDLAPITVRRFDGAETWSYLD
jgi:hypothetical protein